MPRSMTTTRIAWSCLVAAPLACADSADAPSSADQPREQVLAVDLATEHEFGYISGLAALPDGGVVTADQVNHEMSVFAADGTHRYTFGGQGAGPGEVTGPCCVALDDRQRLWVRDGGNSRYNIYRLHPDSAEFVGQVRMSHGDRNRHAPTTFDGAGNVIDIGFRADAQTGEMAVARAHLDSAGVVTNTTRLHAAPPDSTAMKAVQRQTGSGRETRYAHQPFGPTELAAHSPRGGYAHALSGRYAIDWRDEDGNLVRHLSFDMPRGPALSNAERERAEEMMTQQAGFVGVARNQLGFDIPSHKPPLRALFFDREGRLWVELNTAAGADRQAHVYSVDGALERSVTWPRAVNLAHGAITGDVAWGVHLDELDVASLVRLRPAGER